LIFYRNRSSRSSSCPLSINNIILSIVNTFWIRCISLPHQPLKTPTVQSSFFATSVKMSGVAKRANDALAANPNLFLYPQTSDINITTHGSDWYWAVTAVMSVSTIIFIGLSFTVTRRNRTFHYITASITLVAAIAYFTMASNLGYAAIPVEFQRSDPKVSGVFREIFYVRYIDWVITTPVSLVML
jgi:Bacteriorhodopsin-like protein